MAQYSTDFSEYTTGEFPNDWTRTDFLFPALNRIVVQNSVGVRQKSLRNTQVEEASWDKLGTFGNFEVVTRARFATSFNSVRWRKTIDHDGIEKVIEFRFNDFRTRLEMRVLTFSTVHHQKIVDIEIDTQKYHWYRFSVTGLYPNFTLKAKVWDAEESEPLEWTASTTSVLDDFQPIWPDWKPITYGEEFHSGGTLTIGNNAQSGFTFIDVFGASTGETVNISNYLNSTVSGVVRAADTNEPLEQIRVSPGLGYSDVFTGEDGEYSFDIAPGDRRFGWFTRYALTSRPFVPFYKNISVGGGQSIALDVNLDPVKSEISTPADLYNLRYDTWQGENSYTIENDINMLNFSATHLSVDDPMYGTGWCEYYPAFGYAIEFGGTLDGQGYTIRNLKMVSVGEFHPQSFINQTYGGAVIENITFDNCLADGGQDTNAAIGIYYCRDTLVERCFVKNSKVTVGENNEEYNFGGLIGICRGSTSIVRECAAVNTEVHGYESVGGLVGETWNSPTIENCYAIADVKGHEWVGGLVGTLDGAIINSYTASSVQGDTDVGGLVGSVWGGSWVVTNSYYDSQASGQSDDDGRGEPRTTEQMTYPYIPVFYDGLTPKFTYRGWNFGDTLAEGIIEATFGNAFVHTFKDEFGEVEPWGWEGRIQVDEEIIASGFEFANNNGTFTVTSIDTINLFVDATLVPESGSSDKKIVRAEEQIWYISSGTNDGYPYLLLGDTFTVSLSGFSIVNNKVTMLGDLTLQGYDYADCGFELTTDANFDGARRIFAGRLTASGSFSSGAIAIDPYLVYKYRAYASAPGLYTISLSGTFGPVSTPPTELPIQVAYGEKFIDARNATSEAELEEIGREWLKQNW